MSDVTALLAEADWLSRLARRLVGSDDADDIVQETLATALRTPPDPDRPARPWLRRVMLNVVRMRHRGRVRRDVHEQASAIGETVPTPDQLLERARVERTLADLVIALAEPLRSTVLLRYREGMSAEAIAVEQGLSVATVRRRLREGVDELRRGMDERDDPTSWRAAFAPFLVVRPASPPFWSVVMAKLGSKVAIIAIAALLLLVGGGLALHHARGPRSSSSSPLAALPVVKPGSIAQVFAQPGVAEQALEGRVTLDGKPFAGAAVRVIHIGTRELVAEVASGSDGRFAIPNVPAAALMVGASTPDQVSTPVVVDVRSPSVRGQPIELRLTGCVHLRGVVSDGSGAPIARARVAPDVTRSPAAETDELGHFDLCMHRGPQVIRFAASGYHAVIAELSAWTSDILDVTLLPEAVVAGTVLDTGNRPVANAVITIDPRGITSIRYAPVIAHSEADGTFRIAGVAPGRSEIFAEAPGAASRRIGLVLGAGETREGVVLRVAHAPRLAGKVLDPQGRPAVGASVGLHVGSIVREDLAVTQADGSFVIERAPKGTHALVVSHYQVVAPREVTIGDADASIQITAEPLPVITGIVTRDGIPVSQALGQCPAARQQETLMTDTTGAFYCPLDVEGPFELCASNGEGRFGCVKSGWVHGQVLSPIAIELDQAGTICGTVTDTNGVPLRGIKIKGENPALEDYGESTSDDAGAYCLRQLRNEGTYTITAFLGGQLIPPAPPLPPVTLEHGHGTLAITLAAPDQVIAGTIVDGTGSPIADASVQVTVDRLFSNQVDVAVSDATGHFAIQRLAPGAYQVMASARDGASKTVGPIAAGTRDVRVTLDRAGAIEGSLVGFHTQPSIVGVLAGGGLGIVDFEIEGDQFRAHGLPPGLYSVTATTNGHEADSAQVKVGAGATMKVVLTSRGSSTLSGHVIDWIAKRAVTSARCGAPLPRNGNDLGTFYRSPETDQAVDASGAFHFDNVTAGDISIPCFTGAAGGIRIGTIMAGANAQLDVYVVTPKSGGGDIGTLDLATRAMSTVLPNAARSGMQVGDVVMALDGQAVELLDGQAVKNAISNHPPGSSISVAVRRGATALTLEVTL